MMEYLVACRSQLNQPLNNTQRNVSKWQQDQNLVPIIKKKILLAKQAHFNILHKMIRKRKITVRGQNNFKNFYPFDRRCTLFSIKEIYALFSVTVFHILVPKIKVEKAHIQSMNKCDMVQQNYKHVQNKSIQLFLKNELMQYLIHK